MAKQHKQQPKYSLLLLIIVDKKITSSLLMNSSTSSTFTTTMYYGLMVQHLSRVFNDLVTGQLDKAPRPSISNVIWVLSSDTICQFNQIFSNSEAAILSSPLSKG